MANYVKYSTNTQTRALKMGNFWLGPVNDGKGPTSSTGYYTALNPPSGGFTIYTNKTSNGPSIFQASNESQLVSITNQLGGTSFTTSAQCLTWYVTQTDKFCVNREYEGIVTDGLLYNFDAGFSPSYPTSGTSWYDLGPNGNTATLYNGPTFSGGSLLFDGTDDYGVLANNPGAWGQNSLSLCVAVYPEFDGETYGRPIFTKNQSCVAGEWAIEYGRASYNSGTNKFSFNSATFVTSTNTFPKNAWYIVGFSFNASNRNYLMYVNNSLEAIGVGANNINNDNGTFGIGRFNNCYPTVGSWKGRIGFIQLYNRALSSLELLQNYRVMKGRFGL